MKPIVALIYDFDGTLSPGNMQEYGFIQAFGKTPAEFWEKTNRITIDQDMSPILAYMRLIVEEAAARNMPLKLSTLREYGSQIELYPGVLEWFSLINEYGASKGIVIEHYINSSGITEMIEGSPIAHEFKKIFASSFYYDRDGSAVWPAVAVDYTAKTQFLFKITKGIMEVADDTQVNDSRKDEDKPVPFPNMIYIGDGSTDVPCMKIVKMFGGNSIAVYQKNRKEKIETARKLLNQDRVNFICDADYTEGSEIYQAVCTIIDKIKAENDYNSLRRKVYQTAGKSEKSVENEQKEG